MWFRWRCLSQRQARPRSRRGTVSLIGLVLAAGAFVLGIMAVREPKIRPLPPRTALILGGILTVVLAALYISGMV